MGQLSGTGATDIDAPIDEVFKLAADLDGTPAWHGTIRRVEVHARDEAGRATDVTTWNDAKVKEIRARFRFSYTEPTSVRWEQIEGDAKSMSGSWTFTDLGAGRTHAVYTMEGDPGRMLGLLLRGPVEARVREILTKGSVDGLKRALESR